MLAQSTLQVASRIERYPVVWAGDLPRMIGDVWFHFEDQPEHAHQRPWLGVVSSHDSRTGYADPEWQAALQSALHLARQQGWGVLFASQTPYAPCIVHGCQRMHLPWMEVEVSKPKSKLPRDPNSVIQYRSGWQGRLVVHEKSPVESPVPLQDRAAAFLADYVFALKVRSKGKIEQVLRDRLGQPAVPSATTYVALHRSVSDNENRLQAVELLESGAIGWFSSAGSHAPQVLSPDANFELRCKQSAGPTTWQPLISLQSLNRAEGKFLTHCTRSRRGPWPDQSLSQFHDELFHSPWRQHPHPIGTLERILDQKRLIATRNYRRGDVDTICFSEKRIDRLLSMRHFQSHLGRWDWEPYGIMIDKEWLVAQGAQRVNYIDRETAKGLKDRDLTFSQVVSKATGAQDWREEQEWRISGDLRLNRIPFSKAVVFVPTVAEARALQYLSRWPLAVVAQG